jgi:amino acid transporter
MYADVVLGRSVPLLGAISGWAYWVGWTPGIAVNIILASAYLHDTVLGGASVFEAALLILVGLYALTWTGLRPSMRIAAVLAVVSGIPLLAILIGLALHPSLLQVDSLLPFSVPGQSWSEPGTWMLAAKWGFVAAWSAYGAEMASTVTAELRDPQNQLPRAMAIAATVGILAFALTPILLVMAVGVSGLSSEPMTVFETAAREAFGGLGATAVAMMLSASLILGAQAFIVGSSRTVFQMARDGHLPAVLGTVNRRGVPVGSIACDAAVVLSLLLFFHANAVDIVATANVGYIVVFVLLAPTYLAFRMQAGQQARHTLLAVSLGAFNVLLLVVGGPQWGPRVFLTGLAIVALSVPISLAVRRRPRVAFPPTVVAATAGAKLTGRLTGAGAGVPEPGAHRRRIGAVSRRRAAHVR